MIPTELKPADPIMSYRAFLSYSHADARIARWLHARLEGYRFPRGVLLPDGSAPGRLAPIFRDREELPAGASLSADLVAALHGSEALIVLCSRRSARSKWVNREIETFLEHHGRDRVFAVIVDGRAGLAAGDENSCFPPALYTGTGDADLVAPDLRPDGDGKRLGFLKLVAGLADLPLDDLIQRDQQRAIRRLQLVTAASLATVLAFAALGTALYFQRKEALRQRDLAREVRDRAQEMNSYFLTDLRRKLRPLGRLDLLDEATQKVIAYHESIPAELADDPEVLRAKAVAIDYVGQMLMVRGDAGGAVERLRESRKAWIELQSRDDANASAWSGAAVNAQILGEAYRAAGRIEEELASYEKGLADLEGLRAKNPEGDADLARLRSMLLGSSGDARYLLGDASGALRDLDEAAGLAKEAVETAPGNPANWNQAVSAFQSLGEHYVRIGDLENGLTQARSAVDAASTRSNMDLEDADGWRLLANAQQNLMMAHAAREEWEEAGKIARDKLRLRRQIHERDPTNPTARAELGDSEDDLAFALTYLKQPDEAFEHFTEAYNHYAALLPLHPSRMDWRRSLALVLKRRGDLAYEVGFWDGALNDYEGGIVFRKTLVSAVPSNVVYRIELANLHISRGEALWKLERLDEAEAAFLEAGAILADEAVPADHPEAEARREGVQRALADLGKEREARTEVERR